MTSEVVIDVQQKDISIALMEDKQLVEYQNEPREASFSVGNIYIAKVKKLMPGLNACFVDVGYERDAFLHYLDLGSHFNSYQKYLKQVQSDRKKLFPFSKASKMPELEKDGSIQNVLKAGQEVLVQIVKEPISTKGPRLTGEISFAGRYLVLMPFGDKVSVSSKIKSGEERSRLKQLIHSIKPKNCGVIVRTVAEGKKVAELDAELKVLVKRWEDAIAKVQKTQQRPQLAFEETGRAVALLRDLFNPSYENIYVNNEDVMNEVKNYVSLIAPEKAGIVKLYTGKVPIFDNFSITKQIKAGFGRVVNYKHGAYLIIEHTEALHVVDVNSGNRTREKGQEANALDVNLGAADELACIYSCTILEDEGVVASLAYSLDSCTYLCYDRLHEFAALLLQLLLTILVSLLNFLLESLQLSFLLLLCCSVHCAGTLLILVSLTLELILHRLQVILFLLLESFHLAISLSYIWQRLHNLLSIYFTKLLSHHSHWCTEHQH